LQKNRSNYLDHYLLLGRNYDLLNNKGARYYYKYYINKTTSNEIVFNYLINLELEQNNFLEAEKNNDKAIQLYLKQRFRKKENSSLSFAKETKKNITI
jgi:hypothetical protein